MRLALVARGCQPGTGIELYTFELARRLARRHEVEVITQPGRFQKCGAKLIPIKVPEMPPWRSFALFSRAAGDRAREGHYDLVHTQGSDAAWGDVVTAHSCHAAALRASLKLNSRPINQVRKALSPAHRVILELEKETLAHTRHLVSVSRSVWRQVRAAYPMMRHGPGQVIYPGVDLAAYSAAELPLLRQTVRTKLGLREGQVVFVLAANDAIQKGGYRLVQALMYTRQENIVLLIANPRGREERLWALASARGLSGRVRFLAVGTDVRPAYAAADVYCELPEYEAFGLTLLEAMACGRPVLTTRNAGACELMRPEREAVLIPHRASDQRIAQAMDTLAADPRQRTYLAREARATAERFSWDRMVAELETVYAAVPLRSGLEGTTTEPGLTQKIG